MGLAGIAAGVGAVATVGSAVIGAGAASDAANAQTQAANTASQTQLSMYNQTRSDLSGYNTMGSNAFSQLANIFGFGGGGTSGLSGSVGGVGSTGAGQMVDIPGFGSVPLSSLNGSGLTTPQSSATGNVTTGQPNPALATQLLTQFPGYQFGLDQGVQALDRSAASRGLTLSGAQLKDAQQFGIGYAQQNAWQPYVSQLNSAASLGENAAAQTGNAGASAASGIANSQLAAGQAQAAGSVAQGNIIGSGLSQLGQIAQNYGSSYTGLPGYNQIMSNTNSALNSIPVINPMAGY